MPDLSPTSEPRLRVGDFLVCPADGTLRRGDSLERIEPRTMQLLQCLAQHPGRVLSREQIQAAVWPETRVADVVLPRVVFDLRRALGDDAKQPRYVETLPRRGYRLIAPVEPVADGGRRLSAPPARAVALLAATALVALLVLTRSGAPGPAPDAGVADRIRVVVLPFEALGEAGDEWFAAGMTEEVTAQLAAVPGIGVIARTSALRYARERASLRELGRRFDVAWAVEGSVRWEAGHEAPPRRVRVAARLVRVADETPVWSARFDRELGGVLALQAEIARHVAARLGHELAQRDERRPTGSLEAWRAYVRARERIGGTQRVAAESIELGIDLLQRAVDLDPEFALAWAELSRAHSWRHHLGYAPGPASCDAAQAAAERALRLEPRLARARLARGDVLYRCNRGYEGALSEYQRARQTRPGDPDLLAASGYVQRRQGRFREALGGLEAALALDPLSASLAVDVGQTRLALREYGAARVLFDRAIELEPDLNQAWASRIGLTLLAEGDAERALALLEGQPGGPTACERAELEYVAGRPRHAAASLVGCDEAGLTLPWAIWPRALLEGWVDDALEQPDAARHAYAAARRRLATELGERPGDFRLHAALGLALAGLGQGEPAVRSGRRAVELFPPTRDALTGPSQLLQLAWIHSRLGNADAALDLVERLLEMPAGNWLSPASAGLDPRLARLREEPRFQALVRARSEGQ